MLVITVNAIYVYTAKQPLVRRRTIRVHAHHHQLHRTQHQGSDAAQKLLKISITASQAWATSTIRSTTCNLTTNRCLSAVRATTRTQRRHANGEWQEFNIEFNNYFNRDVHTIRDMTLSCLTEMILLLLLLLLSSINDFILIFAWTFIIKRMFDINVA